MSGPARRAALFGLALAYLPATSWGCVPIGRELVDEVSEDTGLAPCPEPLACDALYKEGNEIELSSVSLALTDDLCEVRDREPRRLSYAAIAAGTSEAAVEGGPLLPGASEIIDDGSASIRFECACIELGGDQNDSRPNGDVAEEVRLQGLDLYATELSLSSLVPTTVVLRGARLLEVSIALRGSITLRVERSLAFEGVRIDSEALSGQRPRVELEEVRGQRLLLGSEQQPFAGELLLARSHLTRSRLFASRVQLQSARLGDLAIESDELEGTGASLDRARLAFDEAVLSGSALSRVQIASCGSFTSIWSTIEQSLISACTSGPFHAYSTTVSGALVDGPVDADRAEWNDVLLGLYEDTYMLGWDITMRSATFCSGSRLLRLGGESTISCSDCTAAGFAHSDDICIFPDTYLNAVGNNCPELERVTVCPASVPQVLEPMP